LKKTIAERIQKEAIREGEGMEHMWPADVVLGSDGLKHIVHLDQAIKQNGAGGSGFERTEVLRTRYLK
jgi:hypothetical protein